MAKIMHPHSPSPGFALIEMIGVLMIIAILAGAMAPFLLNQIDRAEGDAEQMALEAIAIGIQEFYLDDSNPATYGTLPGAGAATWQADLAGNYVGRGVAELTTNNRDVARLYSPLYPDFTAAPRITIASHALLGGQPVPAGFAGGCIGSADAAVDPCGNGQVVDFMVNGIARDYIKVVNLNLAEQRAAIIERVKNRYLAPAVEFFESLPNDVCSGIADIPSFAPVIPADGELNTVLGLPGVNGIVAGVPVIEVNDFWAQPIKVTKFGGRIIIWSDGPLGAGVTPGDDPANPLYMTATCAPGSDVVEQLGRIADTLVGAAVAQNPFLAFPGTLAAAGVANGNDPWGTAIVYVPAATSFTITSLGPDIVAGGGDDIVLTKSANELTGLYAAMGRGFGAEPVSPSVNYANCGAVDGWMTAPGNNCNTAINYLINASECDIAIAYDMECTVAGY